MILPTWIKSALESGPHRNLNVCRFSDGWNATLTFHDSGSNSICSRGWNTPEQALAGLDNALMEDAADEMVKKGVV